MKFTERARCFPPILCAILARETKAEHLSLLDQSIMAEATTWDAIPFGRMTAYLNACGLRFDDAKAMRKLNDYLDKRPTLQHLRKSKVWNEYWKPLLAKWRNLYPYNVGPDDMPHKGVRNLLNRLTPLHRSHAEVTQCK